MIIICAVGLSLAAAADTHTAELQLERVLHFNTRDFGSARLVVDVAATTQTQAQSDTPLLTVSWEAAEPESFDFGLLSGTTRAPALNVQGTARQRHQSFAFTPSTRETRVPRLNSPTLLNLAYMSSNAYNSQDYSAAKWRDLDGNWQASGNPLLTRNAFYH
ncbi:MAG: hypothetical protein SGCHY_002513 [Lobulomycetales sp.]